MSIEYAKFLSMITIDAVEEFILFMTGSRKYTVL